MRHRRIVALAALALSVTACKRGASRASTEGPHASPAHPHEAAKHEAAARGGVKPPLRGLVSMGAYKFVPEWGEPDNSMATVDKKAGLLQGVVILATWRNLEKSANGGLTEDNEIDQGLAAVRKYNQEHPNAPLAVKLRVWGGFFAPEWAMHEAGGPVHLVHTNNHGVELKRTVGKVWSQPYRKAWAHLQELLAAKYDADPLVREVAVTSCMMFTAEPFFLDTHEGALEPLRKAGLTDAAYKECLDGIVHDYAPWRTTRFETPLNPFRLTDGAKPKHDEAFTLAWMKRCHEAEPARCAFDNHDLEAHVEKGLETIYEAMEKSGAEVEFQSGPAMPKDLDGMIARAVSAGGTSVELWQDYQGFPEMADAELRRSAKRLEQNRN